MGFVMGEWYAISGHLLLVFGIGFGAGCWFMSDGDKPVVPNTNTQQVEYHETDAGMAQSDFMRRWCAANYGISTKGEQQP
jgi:hypothetical protein